jgi:probable HAF family extracellular repeat protein
MRPFHWLTAALAAAAAAPLAAATEYAVFDLGALTDIPDGSSAAVGGMNASGHVALTNASGGAYHGFRFSGGTSTDLGTLGGAESTAAGINKSGQIVGRSTTTTGVQHAYIWTPGGTGGVVGNPQMKDLNPTAIASEAVAINTSGQVTGFVTIPASGNKTTDRAFRYTAGTMTQLPLPAGTFSASYGYGINDAGKVVGEAYGPANIGQGFLYNGTTSVEIGDLGGGGSTPLAINNNDRAVGYSSTAGGVDHAFVFASGTMTDLGTLGGHYSYAKAINNTNQIVGGSFTDSSDSTYHAFSSDGSAMTDLNTKVTSKAANWVLEEATGISDTGWIAGTGSLSGARHGFLLRPLAPGDATADGTVDFSDLVALAQHYNGGDGALWEEGDFSGDGHVDFNDLVALAQNYNTTQFASDVQAAFASVPEPGVGLFVAAGMLTIRRGRRRPC